MGMKLPLNLYVSFEISLHHLFLFLQVQAKNRQASWEHSQTHSKSKRLLSPLLAELVKYISFLIKI